MNVAWWNGVETDSLRGRTFWRCIEAAFAATALESGPNFLEGGRYSVAQEFSAAYFSENKALARLEKTHGRDVFEDLEDLSFEFRTAIHVPDLTHPGLQARLHKEFGISLAELTAPGVAAYPRTQPVGKSVFNAGLPGLLTPSSHPAMKGQDHWRNLVLFPANVLSQWLVRA